MAGRYTPLHSKIWTNADFVALEPRAQLTYLLVISQPNISYAGVVSLTPGRWARMSANTSSAEIERAIALLEGARFVFVDRSTEELMVRTFVAANRVFEQKQLHNVLRKDYAAVLSTALRCSFYEEQTEQVKVLLGSPPAPSLPGSPSPSPAGSGVLDLDLDLDLNRHQHREPEPAARPLAHHDLLRADSPPDLLGELDQDIAGYVTIYGAAKVDAAVIHLVDDKFRVKYPSKVRLALEAILGPPDLMARPSPMDATNAASAVLREDGMAYIESLRDTQPDPGLNRVGIFDAKAILHGAKKPA